MIHRRSLIWCWAFALGLLVVSFSFAQSEVGPQPGLDSSELQQLQDEATRNKNAPVAPPNTDLSGLNFLSLLLQGGVLMIPIGIMSLIVVTISIERFFACRREALMPSKLNGAIEQMLDSPRSVDPQELYQLALRFPSAAGRVLESMLPKVGRPVVEIEAATTEACEVEANRLYGPVRWLTLAAGVTPLIGLLGTVLGMIYAFHDTTQLGPGRNKAEFLAEGIYVALVTTLGGLGVAIPAAIFAHHFEGRITKMISYVEVQLKRLVPRFERFEGRVRYDLHIQGLVARGGDNKHSEVSRPVPPPPARPPIKN